MQLDELTLQSFEPHVGSTFTLSFREGDPVRLKLVRAVAIMERPRPTPAKRQPFSLYFEGPEAVYLPQRMYDFSHEAIGQHLPIFIVPVGREEGVFRYEAVFT